MKNSFGKKVIKKLQKKGKTQQWLANEIQERSGLYMDRQYLQKILNGQRHPDKVIEAINEILSL